MEKMKLIQRIIEREWTLFDEVHNIGGRASCQDDRETFFIMRGSQFLSWNVPLLNSYENDLRAAQAEGRNLLAEKYGYMMRWTSPKEYDQVRDLLPQVTDEKKGRVLRIAAIHVDWQNEVAKKYPALSQKGRRITQDGSTDTAFESYLKGELLTYSEATLALYEAYLMGCLEKDVNLNEEILRATVHAYGYGSLKEAEEAFSPKNH